MRKKVARPRKEKKPITSVTVVTTTLPAMAGSWLNLCKIIGIKIPAIAEDIRFTTIATQIRVAMIASPNQIYVIPPTIIDSKIPFTTDTATSLL